MKLRRTLVLAAIALSSLLPSPANAQTGPAYAGDFADPFILRIGSTYLAYATQTGSANIQGMRSQGNPYAWQGSGEVLPLLPLWARRGQTWAPSALQLGSSYRLYYTASHGASGRQCISVASSPLPQGPFLDLSLSPWLCQLERGGSIDPDVFVDDDGSAYLLWKSEDNVLGRPSIIWSQRLSSDGLSLVGTPAQLLIQDQPWEAPGVEGPAMVRAGGSYYLFYGANRWDSPDSAIGYATCDGPAGPCRKVTTSAPWLRSDSQAVGPAGPAVFEDDAGNPHIAYHAWSPGKVGYAAGGVRSLWVKRLTFMSGKPVASGP